MVVTEYVGRCSYGVKPKEFHDGDGSHDVVAKMEFDIHDFKNIQHKKWGYFYTPTIKAQYGLKWKLQIFPRGSIDSKDKNAEYVSIYLCYAGCDNNYNNDNSSSNNNNNNNEGTNNNDIGEPVIAKGWIRTKTHNIELGRQVYTVERSKWGSPIDIGRRNDILHYDCNIAGTLRVTVEIQIATEKRSVWYPPRDSYGYGNNNNLGMLLYESRNETNDVTFVVGKSKTKFPIHKNVLAVRAKDLYELVVTTEEEEVESNTADDDIDSKKTSTTTEIVLDNIDEVAFGKMVRYIYLGRKPSAKRMTAVSVSATATSTATTVNDNNSNDAATTTTSTNCNKKESLKSLLIVADRYDVKELKLYIESVLVDKFLSPSTGAEFLLFGDSYSCALLKEASMNMYRKDSDSFMMTEDSSMNENNTNNNNLSSSTNNNVSSTITYWHNLQESTRLLTELLVYTNNCGGGRNYNNTISKMIQYSSVTDDGDGTVVDADTYDVTSLRERLHKHNLDLDGSREIILQRWKDHLLLTTPSS